jgi:tetratricopeptide (TPR) repeat protein
VKGGKKQNIALISKKITMEGKTMRKTIISLFVILFVCSLMLVACDASKGKGKRAQAELAVVDGLMAFSEHSYDEAIRLYTKAIESGELSQKDLILAYYDRGEAWIGKGDCDKTIACDKAIADYTKAIELDSKFVQAYDGRGSAWFIKGDYDKAIADFTKAIEIDPKYDQAYYGRANAWEKKGDLNKAKADRAKGKEVNPNPYR